MTLKGVWTCERCGQLPPLQISPLTGGLSCPTCRNAIVFVPEFVPVSDEVGKKFFDGLRKQLGI